MRASDGDEPAREDIGEERIRAVHAAKAISDDASAADPRAVLGLDDDGLHVVAARLAADIEHAWHDRLPRRCRDAEPWLERREHARLPAAQGLAARAGDEREERRACDVEREWGAWPGVEHGTRDERVDDLLQRHGVERERVHGRATVVDRARSGGPDEPLQRCTVVRERRYAHGDGRGLAPRLLRANDGTLGR